MAANDDKRMVIVVKRGRRAHGGSHGGSWKIAYADFVTAMMAFFLLMWLLGSTTQGDLQGIAEYFKNPMRVSMSGGSGAGDATSPIQGGGTDLSRKTGQVRLGVEASRKVGADADETELARQDAARLTELKRHIEAAIDASPGMRPYKEQLRLELTSEGLRIQIHDEQNRPMFDLGSARLKDYARTILREMASLLNEVDHSVMLSGHTDATPYVSRERGYSNWELSADRANAARRELVAGGLDENKILRVVGLSSVVPFNAADRFDPMNRRISIIVANHKTEALIRRDGAVTPRVSEEVVPAAPPSPLASATPQVGSPPTAAKVPADSAVNSEGRPARL